MRSCAAILFAAVTIAGFLHLPVARANADDAAWIKRCVADNADEGQAPTIIAAYCSCMNNKMSANETLSITAWEKTHPAERKSCSIEAGWK